MKVKKLKGVIPVLITPLNKNKSIDVIALKELCNYYEREQKISGVWILGTGAEDMCLSFKQRLLVAETTTEAFSNNVIKLIGCSFFSPKESIEYIQNISSLEFDAYHAMPYHPKVSLKQILSWYNLLADNCDKPLWAYTSGNWAQRMGPNFIAEVKKIPNIVGVKYSSSNTVDVQGAIELQDDDFQVITAVVKTLYSSLCLGVSAATTVEASAFYPEISNIFELFKSGDFDSAYNAQKHLNNSLLNYPSPAAKDNFLRIAELKYLLSIQGICKEYVTEFYRELNENEKSDILNWYKQNLHERRTN